MFQTNRQNWITLLKYYLSYKTLFITQFKVHNVLGLYDSSLFFQCLLKDIVV